MESCEAEKLLTRLARKNRYDITQTIKAPLDITDLDFIIKDYFFTMNANLSFSFKEPFFEQVVRHEGDSDR